MSGARPAAPRDGAALSLRIDKDDPTPAYLQLRAQLAEAVRSGRLIPGTALPSERGLAHGLQLSRMTVRRALEELVHERVLEKRHGSGTYVRGRRVEQTFDRVLGFTDEARGLGITPGTTLLEIREAAAEEEAADALGLEQGTTVLVVTRLRTANGLPLAIQSAYLPPAFAALSLDLLRRNESLYATLREQFGVVPHGARQTVTARLADAWERRWLEVGPHVPVLSLERTTRSADGRVFEYVQSAYRGDRYRLALDLGPPHPAASSGSRDQEGAR